MSSSIRLTLKEPDLFGSHLFDSLLPREKKGREPLLKLYKTGQHPLVPLKGKRFLGLSSYYHHYIIGFTDIAYPLQQCTEKPQPLAWTGEVNRAFPFLKHVLTEAPILNYPTPYDQFILKYIKTLGLVRERFYWCQCRRDTEAWCRSCDLCASRKGAPKNIRAPIAQYNVASPMETLAVDVMGPPSQAKICINEWS